MNVCGVNQVATTRDRCGTLDEWDANILLLTKCVPPGLLKRRPKRIDGKSMGVQG